MDGEFVGVRVLDSVPGGVCVADAEIDAVPDVDAVTEAVSDGEGLRLSDGAVHRVSAGDVFFEGL